MSLAPTANSVNNNGEAVQPNSGGEVLVPQEEMEVGATFWDFMLSATGGTAVHKFLDLIQNLQKSTIEANAEQNRQQIQNNAEQMRRQIWTGRLSLIMSGTILACLIAVTAYLAVHEKLSGTASTVICTTLGYLFGRSGKGQ